jgi:diguanylate cyclase (GGDEF)-like protein
MKPLRWRASLRGKLILACVLLLALSAGMLLLGNKHILQRTLSQQVIYQTHQVTALLDQSIAIPLAQRDYAVLQQTLDRVVSNDAISYIVLLDHRGRRVASAGWDATRALPPRDTDDIDLHASGTMRHLASSITMEKQVLGTARFGLSIVGLRAAQSDFERQSMAIAALTLLLSIGLITVLATALTRHLVLLEDSSRRMAEGDFDVLVPQTSGDEIGRLAASFSHMAVALRDRISALHASEQLQAQHLQQARAEQARLSALIDAIPAGIVFVDGAGRILHANGAFVSMWQLAGDPAGSPVMNIVQHLRSRTVASDAAILEYLLRPPLPDELASDVEFHTEDGRLIAQQVRAVLQADGGSGYVCLHEDVTQARNNQQRARLALLDPLTQLLNRRGLFEALVGATTRADEQGAALVLMFIDLDDFKHANDVGGHRKGDEILVAIAATLSEHLRNGETIARIGGDEFAVICPAISIDQASMVAARLVEAVSRLCFAAEGEVLRVGCSIGLASYPLDARTPDDLVACADTAMYQAKQRGKNDWVPFQPDATRLRCNGTRIDWNDRIHRALEDNRFLLHFQPVFHAGGRKIAYHEALLRMADEDDPDRLVSPADFIPHAERSGKIRQIDRWVFDACVTRLALQPELVLAANLSARSLEDSSFPSFLREAMLRADIAPGRLHIELTETSAIADPATAMSLITGLRALGCAVHLDDFGSGFSSFNHLKLLDVDSIKIDGAFIRDLDSDPNNQLFVGAMIAIARQLNKTTVAEHVENQATLDLLVKMGIDHVQGFHIGRPAREPLTPRSRVVALQRGDSSAAA